jgi:hypothetical protein
VYATKDIRFAIRTRCPSPINTDGELVTFTPARFAVLRKPITVFTPNEKLTEIKPPNRPRPESAPATDIPVPGCTITC